MQNIIKEPNNEKFRILKRTNKTIAAKLMALKPNDKIIELITIMGYVQMDDDISAFVGDYFHGLVQGTRLVDDQSMRLKMLSMSDEDRKKQELIFKERAAFLEKQKAKIAEQKRIEQISQANRKVKQAEESQTSVGNKLNFGANMVKFEPPKESKGG